MSLPTTAINHVAGQATQYGTALMEQGLKSLGNEHLIKFCTATGAVGILLSKVVDKGVDAAHTVCNNTSGWVKGRLAPKPAPVEAPQEPAPTLNEDTGDEAPTRPKATRKPGHVYNPATHRSSRLAI